MISKSQIKLYEKSFFHHDYYAWFPDRMSKVLSLFENHANEKILDIGCGDGKFSDMLKKKTNADVYALENVKSLFEKARKIGIKVKLFDFDGAKLPFNSSSFDAVFCGEVIEHIYETENLLREIHRILKPSGYVVITTPNIASWYNRILLLFGYMPIWIESGSENAFGHKYASTCGHIKAFTKKSLQQMLEKYGFEIEAIKGSAFINRIAIADAVEKLFSLLPTSSSFLIFKARK